MSLCYVLDMHVVTPSRVRFLAFGMIACTLLLVAYNFATQRGGITVFGPEFGGDYAAYYMAGQILNSEPRQLYDLPSQERRYHEIIPAAPENQFLVYPGAPFVAVLYRPLARLPFAWSHLLWLLIGAALAAVAVGLLWKSCGESLEGDRATAMVAALSFAPFLIEGWAGGQTSAMVLFAVSLAVFLQQRQRPIGAGVTLAFLAFKPTLLLLLGPMLLVTKSFRVLLGLLIGGIGFLLISIWAVGLEGCRQYVLFLTKYAAVRNASPESLKPWKYVDLRSAVYPVFYHPQPWAMALVAALFLAGAALLWLTWRRSTDWRIAWASALAWTPVLSPHIAIYDTTLLIPAVFLAVSSFGLDRRLRWLIVALYLTAWCTQAVSEAVGVQMLSLVIVLLGVYLWKKAATTCVANELLTETAYLLKSPKNAQRLTDAIEELKRDQGV